MEYVAIRSQGLSGNKADHRTKHLCNKYMYVQLRYTISAFAESIGVFS
jgi:hypothetical protein